MRDSGWYVLAIVQQRHDASVQRFQRAPIMLGNGRRTNLSFIYCPTFTMSPTWTVNVLGMAGMLLLLLQDNN